MSSSSVKSAERVLNVLRFLAGRVRPAPSMVIARELGLPKSSAYHLLNVMRQKDFVTHYPEERAWGLGPAAFDIGSSYLRAEPLTWLGRPLLRKLAASSRATAHLAVLHGQDVLYLIKEFPAHGGPLLVSRVGLRLPAHLTAVGQAVMMYLPPLHLRAIYASEQGLMRRTRRGPAALPELERELAAARTRGYATDEEMTTLGISCLAAPVFSHDGRPVAGVGLTFATEQWQPVARPQLAAQAVTCAHELSRALGWRGTRSPGTGGTSEDMLTLRRSA